ncbi:MAG: DUF4294 domain-containing protein [Bacteroidetes bacterium]|jgi:hypothetical protein|nr:DUF4294 domain-containing protein [Bacteroidota bacterium]
MKFIGFLLVFCCCAALIKAQDQLPRQLSTGKNDTIKTYVTNIDGELVPMIVTPEIKIVDVRIFKSKADRDAYNRLRYNVYKVMPYAKLAADRYQKLQRSLATTADKKVQKRMVDTCETEIKALFKKEIENLTISQGEILIKLIDRQTGTTSYEMVKDLKGGLKAFMFQSVARFFGHNLKETYDPSEERDIEAILQQAGYYSYQN